MKNRDELLKVLEEMSSCYKQMSLIAEKLKEMLCETNVSAPFAMAQHENPAVTQPTAPVAAQPVPTAMTQPTATMETLSATSIDTLMSKAKAHTLSKEELRGFLGRKANEDSGRYKGHVQSVLKKYGDGKLTHVPETSYLDLLKELKKKTDTETPVSA